MRKANQNYSGRNGFDEVTKRFPTESMKEPEATENQDLARFVIREMGSFFPSLAEMKQEVKASDAPETVATLTERIKRSKRENQEDVAKLSRYYAQGLYDDAMDRYCQTDDIKYHDFEDFARSSDEWAQHYATLENYFRQHNKIAASEHNNLVGRMQYDHLREVLPLYARRREAEKKEEMARLIQAAAKEAHFPQSIKEYRMMDGRKEGQQQLLIARFLMASEPNQGVLRTRCRWTRMQTEPLINEYKNDASFRAEIEAFVSGQGKSRDLRTRRRGELGSG